MKYGNSINYGGREKYDLINKFNYKNITEIPKIEKISLSFNEKKIELRNLVSSLVALELLTNQRGYLLRSKVFSVSLKIRKGDPIGSRITLRKKKLLKFLFKLQNLNKKITNIGKNSLSFQVKNIMVFKEMEENYHFFRKLNSLNINITSTSLTKEEFIFLLIFYKLIKKICRNNLKVEYNLAKVKVRVQFPFFAKDK